MYIGQTLVSVQDLLVQRECELVNRESGGEVGTGTMVVESIKIEE